MTAGAANPNSRSGQTEAVESRQPDGAIVRASRSNAAAFAQIFDRHFERIHRYLARRVGPEVAEDLAPETFLIAFRSRHKFDRRWSDARPWLFGIASNLMRHHWRDERRALSAYAKSGIDPLADQTADIERRADAAAAGPTLAQALASIPDREREVLLPAAWAELSYVEIAEALAIPVGTVRSRLSRARGALSEVLAADVARSFRPGVAAAAVIRHARHALAAPPGDAAVHRSARKG
jgi:RNA polymerase sigma-70 factor (ECF subfamily)